MFGSKSRFNDLCLDILTKLKVKYSFIKRIYVRAEYEYVSQEYTNYLLQNYEETYYPKEISGAGKYSYVERNQIMIDQSDYCLFYFIDSYEDDVKKSLSRSGTKIAYKYAKSKNKTILNVSI